MREMVTKVIDGDEYFIYPQNPIRGFKLLTEILGILGPALAGVFKGETSLAELYLKDMKNIKVGDIGIEGIISGLCERLSDSDNTYSIVLKILSSTKPKNHLTIDSDTVFNAVFKGRYLHLLKVIKTVLEVEYSDFFGIAKGKLEDSKADLPAIMNRKASKSPGGAGG